jgi:hypothetical protein
VVNFCIVNFRVVNFRVVNFCIVNFRVAFLSSISGRCIRFHSKRYHMLVGYMKCETLSVKERTLVECMHLVKNASCMPQAIVTKFEFEIEFDSIWKKYDCLKFNMKTIREYTSYKYLNILFFSKFYIPKYLLYI